MNGAVRLIVPIKSLSKAKSRLAPVLPDGRRRMLAIAMFLHVVGTAREVGGVDPLVVAGDEVTAAICDRIGVGWARDGGGGLNRCLEVAFKCGRGSEIAAFVPADLPLLTRDDLEALLSPARRGSVAIATDRSGNGTNGIALPAGVEFVPAMGPGSAGRHLARFEAAGHRTEVVRSMGLGLDIDTPSDLEFLESKYPGWWAEAARAVESLGLSESPPR
ncbi:MAG: 2-phospho-L-lactate guanylyltransferase [Chloroflexi bacterium]|nr:2-phospho-L-lactate guanylyltransferase [Chloroflexota bacterium]